MARLTIAALTNETRGSRFFEFHSGDHFNFAGTYAVDVDDDLMGTPEGWALVDEAMFAIGNRQRPDANGTNWPAFVRSLSVGDALIVFPDVRDAFYEADVTVHAVESFGFRAHPCRLTVDDDGIVLTMRPR